MASQYPIWNDVSTDAYSSSKSWGARKEAFVSVKVGSSKRNSNDFVEHSTYKYQYNHPTYGDVIVFEFQADGVILKRMIFENNKGRAGKLLKTRNKLNKIKSL